RLRVRPRQPLQRARPAVAAEGWPQAESVRRHPRRTDPARQAVLLRRAASDDDATEPARSAGVRADGRDDGRRLHHLRVARVQRRPRPGARGAVCRQSDRPEPDQPRGAQRLAQAAAADRRVRQGVLGRAGARERVADPDPRRPPGEPEAFLRRALHADDRRPHGPLRRRRQQRAGDEPAGVRRPRAQLHLRPHVGPQFVDGEFVPPARQRRLRQQTGTELLRRAGRRDQRLHLVPGYIRLIVNNGFNIGNGSFNSNTYTKVQNAGASDDFTVVRGAHQFGFGGHYLWTKSDSVANAWSVGSYTFTGQFTGNATADFITGRVAQHRQANPNPVRVTQPISAAYVQDTWKLNRVTLNYGVVWNPFLPMNFYDADVYNFDIDAFNKGTRSQVMKNAPPGFSYPGDPGFEGNSGVKSHYREFDPRVGFAWDVTGDGRTAVRAGAGLGHDYVHQYVHLNTSSVAPFR